MEMGNGSSWEPVAYHAPTVTFSVSRGPFATERLLGTLQVTSGNPSLLFGSAGSTSETLPPPRAAVASSRVGGFADLMPNATVSKARHFPPKSACHLLSKDCQSVYVWAHDTVLPKVNGDVRQSSLTADFVPTSRHTHTQHTAAQVSGAKVKLARRACNSGWSRTSADAPPASFGCAVITRASKGSAEWHDRAGSLGRRCPRRPQRTEGSTAAMDSVSARGRDRRA